MSWLGVGLPFSTRMTVIRLAGGIWLHSPTPPVDRLCAAIERLGEVRFLVAPSRLHDTWIGAWRQRYPRALAWAAPGMRGAARFDRALLDGPPPEWRPDIDLVAVRGDLLTEVEFWHRPSRTLILTDLIENVEPARVSCRHLRLLMRLGGVLDPDGKTPYDLRLTFLRHRPALRATLATMLAWHPERIVLAHGRWYRENAEAELRRAFRWLL
ncbi:MAG TPA: DUF4336 domain-containing protein [Geminicoccaceae bacterium]|nr:DUF4336 domain-containing protein [Geminicoccaceae bacterium]